MPLAALSHTLMFGDPIVKDFLRTRGEIVGVDYSHAMHLVPGRFGIHRRARPAPALSNRRTIGHSASRPASRAISVTDPFGLPGEVVLRRESRNVSQARGRRRHVSSRDDLLPNGTVTPRLRRGRSVRRAGERTFKTAPDLAPWSRIHLWARRMVRGRRLNGFPVRCSILSRRRVSQPSGSTAADRRCAQAGGRARPGRNGGSRHLPAVYERYRCLPAQFANTVSPCGALLIRCRGEDIRNCPGDVMPLAPARFRHYSEPHLLNRSGSR